MERGELGSDLRSVGLQSLHTGSAMVPLPGGQAVDTGQANDHGYSLGEDQ